MFDESVTTVQGLNDDFVTSRAPFYQAEFWQMREQVLTLELKLAFTYACQAASQSQ